MLTRLQLYLLIGSIFIGAIVIAVCEFWPKPPSQQPDSSIPGALTDADSGQETDSSTAATETRRALPETPLPSSYFKLTVKTRNSVEESTVIQKIDADIELKYAHQKTNDGIILTFYSMGLKMYQGGTVVEDTLITRDKFVQQQGNQKTESPFDELPSEQQEMMAAGFATNLCKIMLDTDQNELGRQILSDAGYAMIKEGNLNSLRLMHGPYHHGTDHWKGVKRIPMTMGLILDCPLEYTKAKGNENEINLSGSLSKDEVTSPQADVVIKNVACSLSGKESFDEGIGEYISGEIKLQYEFQVFQKDIQTGTLGGQLELSLERVTTKEK